MLSRRMPCVPDTLARTPSTGVKSMADHIAPLLCAICNASLKSAVMPVSQKQAVVYPRLKKATLDPDNPSSYRPISNLSFISKLVERVVASRFVKHAEGKELFAVNQSAYRHHHSTETAVCILHNDLVRAIDKGHVTALVLLDLSAAFDTVDHELLIEVLKKRFAIDGVALNWFKSYLDDRTQTFMFGNVESVLYAVNSSVPQGSVLGPLEFVAYTEDVVDIMHQHQLRHHIYADDMQLYAHSTLKDVHSMLLQLQNCIIDVREWCTSRRLQLNDAKTELTWFGSRASLTKLASSDCSLLVGGNIIKPSTTVRDLGVLLDSELSLKQHVNKVVSSCYYHIRRLRQVSHCVGQDVMIQLASAFILSRLDYCNSILAGLPKSTIASLQRVQNAAARMVLNLRPRDSISDGLRQLHWLPIESRIQFKLCLLMHLIHTGRCPSYISETVQLVADNAGRAGLRSASTSRYILPRLRTVFGERAFSFSGPKAWNALPVRFHSIESTDSFKKQLKTFLFNHSV